MCENFQYLTIGSTQKNSIGIEIRTAKRISNLIPTHRLCRISNTLTDSKKIKKKPNRKKKNKAQDSIKIPLRYFKRREVLLISPNNLFK